jgi:hypothetical protein
VYRKNGLGQPSQMTGKKGHFDFTLMLTEQNILFCFHVLDSAY